MGTELLLLGAIFAWTTSCFYWKATEAVSDSATWWILIFGYIGGFFVAFGVIPDLKGDPIEMSIRFLVSQFGIVGLVEAVVGAILGSKLGSRG